MVIYLTLLCALVGVLRCASCCPVHRQADIDWDSEPVAVSGEQAALFA